MYSLRSATSKLLLLYAVRIMAQMSPLTPDSNVLINCQTPGACKSELTTREDDGPVIEIIKAVLFPLLARTTEVGARTLVHAVESDLPVEAHGKFLMDCAISQ